jgi:hypothetical protein
MSDGVSRLLQIHIYPRMNISQARRLRLTMFGVSVGSEDGDGSILLQWSFKPSLASSTAHWLFECSVRALTIPCWWRWVWGGVTLKARCISTYDAIRNRTYFLRRHTYGIFKAGRCEKISSWFLDKGDDGNLARRMIFKGGGLSRQKKLRILLEVP